MNMNDNSTTIGNIIYFPKFYKFQIQSILLKFQNIDPCAGEMRNHQTPSYVYALKALKF